MTAQQLNTQNNRLEILLFRLGTSQCFGINVLKVKEIIPCPTLTQLPEADPVIRGVASLRGQTLSVIDLAKAIGHHGRNAPTDNKCEGSVIIAEFNRGLHGFLVGSVDRIVTLNWKDVLPPPSGLGTSIYSSGVTREKDELIQILDLERIIAEFEDPTCMDYTTISSDSLSAQAKRQWVLVVDDSAMARAQTGRTLDSLQVPYIMARDGKEAIELLKKLNHPSADAADAISVVLSDIEMPEMNGYTLTQSIRKDPNLSDLYILLHTSLNGAINIQRAEQCGANTILTKFVPNELAKEILKGLETVAENKTVT